MKTISPQLHQSLTNHAASLQGASVDAMMAQDSRDDLRMGLAVDGQNALVAEFSKQPIDAQTIQLLGQLCEDQGVTQARDAMVAGQAVNGAEGREALHMALRSPTGGRAYKDQDGNDVSTLIHQTLEQIAAFCDQVHSGQRLTGKGERFTSVVNIGIGGSDLGPRMVVEALAPFADRGLAAHFVSNVDPSDLHAVLQRIDPRTTLFVVASKTFTTQETLTNARAARAWLVEQLGTDQVDGQFVAVTAAPDKAQDFGISADAIFPFWDWVGGRYSLWSAIGLPIALTVGAERFGELLAGANAMDEHFIAQPFTRNIPMMMGALSFYYRNYWGISSHAVLPYDQDLSSLPAYLQQLEMESNGKSVREDGSPCDVATSPVIWGAAGTNAQHSFFQMLHQGRDNISMDLLAAAISPTGDHDQHRILLANFLAQGRAFMVGQDQATAKQRMLGKGLDAAAAQLAAQHSVIVGNRPVTSVIYPRLTPWVLGALIAMYEHRVFVQAKLAGINPFDQWGVELGKVLAKEILPKLGVDEPAGLDASTDYLIDQMKTWQG